MKTRGANSGDLTRLYLVRHGQVEGFEQPRYNGQGEVALTALGKEQYRRLRERLQSRPLQAVYSSDLERCMEGARLLAEAHGLSPVPLRELRELHIGQWQGLAWTDLQERYPGQWAARLKDIVHYRVPGGESFLDLSRRVLPALERVLAKHPGAEVLVVGHGAVNRVILLDALGAPLQSVFRIEQHYGCLNIIDYRADGSVSVRLVNG